MKRHSAIKHGIMPFAVSFLSLEHLVYFYVTDAVKLIIDDVCLFNVATRRAESQMQTLVTIEL